MIKARARTPQRWTAATLVVLISALVTLGLDGPAMASTQNTVTPEVNVNNGTFSTEVPIELPPFHGLEPALAIRYDSTRLNGWMGVGWKLDGLSNIEVRSAGQGMAVYGWNAPYLDGEKLYPCTTLGGTHCTKIQSYQRIVWDAAANTWTIWRKDGTKTVFSPILSIAAGTYRWSPTSVTDVHGNTVNYGYWCDATKECYLDTIAYNPNGTTGTLVKFYREARTDDVRSSMKGDVAGPMLMAYRLKSIDVKVNGSRVRAYKLGYVASVGTGRSLLASVQRFGKDAAVTAAGVVTGTSAFPVTTFGYAPSANGPAFAPLASSVLSGDHGAGATQWTREVGDFNGDGKADIVSYNNTSSGWQARVSFSNGDGTFAAPTTTWTEAGNFASPWKGAVGDFNGDGKSDLLLYKLDATGWHVKVAFSNGLGSFSATKNYLPLEAGDFTGYKVALSDSEGDGLQDINVWRLTGTFQKVRRASSQVAAGVWSLKAPVDRMNNTGTGFTPSQLYVVDRLGGGFDSSIAWFNPSTWSSSSSDVDGDGTDESLSHVADDFGWRATTYFHEGCTVNLTTNACSWDPSTQVNHNLFTSGALPGWGTATGDFNADKKTDLALVVPNQFSLRVAMSKGDGTFSPYVAYTAAGSAAGYKVLTGDFNGDGRTDFVWTLASAASLTVKTALSTVGYEGLLTSVSNGLGGSTTVTYAPSSAWANTYLPVGMVLQTVRTLTTNDGRGHASTRTFSYAGGLWSDSQRRLLDFRKVVTVLDGAGTYSEVYYHQHAGCRSKVESSYLKDAQGNIYDYSTNEYTENAAVPYTSLLTRSWAYECNRGPLSGCRKVRTDYTYDAYANVTQQIAYGNDAVSGDEVTTVTGFVPNTAKYIVSAPAYVNVYQGVGTTALMKQTLSYYDGATAYTVAPTKGNRTKTSAWNNETGGYASTLASYDAYGNMTSTTDAMGHTSTTAYDPTYHQYPTQQCNALNQCSSTAWDARLSVRTSETDPNGRVTAFTYDALGRPVRTTYPNAGWEEKSYVSFGTPTAQYIQNKSSDTSTDGLWSREYIDGLGRVYQQTREGGYTQLTTYAVDVPSRVAQESAWYAAGETAKYDAYAYDGAGRKVKTTHADGTAEDITYGVGSATFFDELDHQKTIFSDAWGRTATVREKLGATSIDTKYVYDALGRLTRVTDAAGNQTTTTWNSLGHKRNSCDPDMGCWSYTYNAVGSVLTVKDAKNATMSITYDALERPLTKTGGYSWKYDEAGHGDGKGRLTTRTFPIGTDSITYDFAGRETSKTLCRDAVCYTLGQTYDTVGAGRLSSTVYPDETVTYTYNTKGELSAVPGYATSLVWNARGQLVSAAFANGTSETYAYNANNFRLTQNKVLRGATPLYQGDYGYALDGQVASLAVTNGTPSNLTFAYDTIHRLTSVGGAQTQTLAYDAIGNITSNSLVGVYAYASSAHKHAVTSAGSAAYAYDANGNVTSFSGRTLAWDAENRPTSITKAGVTTNYRYDNDGKRVKKDQPVATYYFDDLLERAGTTLTKYVYAGGRRLARRDGVGTKYFFHRDTLDSTRLMTDGAGAVVRTYDYRPFGDVASTSGTLTNDVRFGGHRDDDESDLIYMNARYYAPLLGRFVSADTMVSDPFNPQDLNRYSYVRNNPLRYVDPTGHFVAGTSGGVGGGPGQPSTERKSNSNPGPAVGGGRSGDGRGSANHGSRPSKARFRDAVPADLGMMPGSRVQTHMEDGTPIPGSGPDGYGPRSLSAHEFFDSLEREARTLLGPCPGCSGAQMLDRYRGAAHLTDMMDRVSTIDGSGFDTLERLDRISRLNNDIGRYMDHEILGRPSNPNVESIVTGAFSKGPFGPFSPLSKSQSLGNRVAKPDSSESNDDSDDNDKHP